MSEDITNPTGTEDHVSESAISSEPLMVALDCRFNQRNMTEDEFREIVPALKEGMETLRLFRQNWGLSRAHQRFELEQRLGSHGRDREMVDMFMQFADIMEPPSEDELIEELGLEHGILYIGADPRDIQPWEGNLIIRETIFDDVLDSPVEAWNPEISEIEDMFELEAEETYPVDEAITELAFEETMKRTMNRKVTP